VPSTSLAQLIDLVTELINVNMRLAVPSVYAHGGAKRCDFFPSLREGILPKTAVDAALPHQ
jgi:hypothetical protein